MSLTSAMFTGVSGLVTNGDALNVIGNNIANGMYLLTLHTDAGSEVIHMVVEQ